MKKILQERVNREDGDCARAVIASLFDKDISEVPQFFPDGTQAYEIVKFFKSQGFEDVTFYNRRDDRFPTIEEVAKYDGGFNGYFYASVPSQTFEGVSHAVIVDIDLNIVHDPNPNQLALKLSPKDVNLIIVTGSWHINLDGEFVRE